MIKGYSFIGRVKILIPGGAQRSTRTRPCTVLYSNVGHIFRLDLRYNPRREEHSNGKEDKKKGKDKGKECFDNGREFDVFIARQELGEGLDLQLKKKKIDGRNNKVANESGDKILEGKGNDHGNGIT